MNSQAKTLLVTAFSPGPPTGGRVLLSRVVSRALHDICGLHLSVLELEPRPLRGLDAVLGVATGYVDGLTQRVVTATVRIVEESGVEKVFIDGSNLGVLVKALKRTRPTLEVTTLFHNCEARFFLGSLRQNRSLRSIGVLLANYRAERLAVKFSDKLLCLNLRDSALLSRLYGRSATHIMPMAMEDRMPKDHAGPAKSARERYALFVGGTFYANRQGIEWFVDQVAKQAPIKTYVVGKGFERWKDQLERNGNVEVVGAVESLAPWYLGAQVVIAPIFDGSGMKTKVAEALMFGKRVIATPEALAGYEAVAGDIGVMCSSASEFLIALQKEAKSAPAGFDARLRGIYEAHYSYPAAKARLAAIIDDKDTSMLACHS